MCRWPCRCANNDTRLAFTLLVRRAPDRISREHSVGDRFDNRAGDADGRHFCGLQPAALRLVPLATHPKDAGRIGHELNEFERRQLVEWVPKAGDFLKHYDEYRTYHDVSGPYRDVLHNYSTAFSPRAVFTQPYASDYLLLQPRDGCVCWSWMRIGAAADYLASRCKVDTARATNPPVQETLPGKLEKCAGRVRTWSPTSTAEPADRALMQSMRSSRSAIQKTWTLAFAPLACEAADAADPFAGLVAFLSPGKAIIEASRPFSRIGATIFWALMSYIQVASARLRPDTLSAFPFGPGA